MGNTLESYEAATVDLYFVTLKLVCRPIPVLNLCKGSVLHVMHIVYSESLLNEDDKFC